jgi:hypothetical protein
MARATGNGQRHYRKRSSRSNLELLPLPVARWLGKLLSVENVWTTAGIRGPLVILEFGVWRPMTVSTVAVSGQRQERVNYCWD